MRSQRRHAKIPVRHHCCCPLLFAACAILLRPALEMLAVQRTPPPSMMASNLFTQERTFFIAAPHVGNLGWDPLKLASGPHLVPMRHAEVKHGRLAMLAAIAWPAQEMLHQPVVGLLRAMQVPSVRDVLEVTGGFSPSLLHGGLDLPEVAPALALAIGVGAAAEVGDVHKRSQEGLPFYAFAPNSIAGNAEFDPLGLAKELGVTDRYELQEAEMINGRLAMLALLAYAYIEAPAPLGLNTRVIDFL